MTKWADYGIYAVRFNSIHTHIDRVRAFPDNGESFGQSVEISRADVVSMLKRGVTFVTIVKNGDKWSKGQPVHIVVINNVEYIKTSNNGKTSDNLDELPEF